MDNETKSAVVALRERLENADTATRRDAAQSLGMALDQPSGDVGRVVIWCLVIAVLAAIFFFSSWLSYERAVDDKALAPFSEFAAVVVGGIVGLIAPSPVKK